MTQRGQPGDGGGLRAALIAAAALPLAYVAGREWGLLGPSLRWVAVGAAPLLALLAVVLFEPPRGRPLRAWLRAVARRLGPAPSEAPPAARPPARASAPPPDRAPPPAPLTGVRRAATPRPPAAPPPPSPPRATEQYLPRPQAFAPPYPEPREPELRLASLGTTGDILPILEPAPPPEEPTQRLLPSVVVTPQPALEVTELEPPRASELDGLDGEEATVRHLPSLEGPPPPAVPPVSLEQVRGASKPRTPSGAGYREAYQAGEGNAPTRQLPRTGGEGAAPTPRRRSSR